MWSPHYDVKCIIMWTEKFPMKAITSAFYKILLHYLGTEFKKKVFIVCDLPRLKSITIQFCNIPTQKQTTTKQILVLHL